MFVYICEKDTIDEIWFTTHEEAVKYLKCYVDLIFNAGGCIIPKNIVKREVPENFDSFHFRTMYLRAEDTPFWGY